MNNRVCYRKIRTYTDLRIERMRVDRELDSLGERLKADWRGLLPRFSLGYLSTTQMFSMGYLVDRITGRASQMYAFVQWGMSAYSHVRSIIEKHKAEKSGQGSQNGR